MTQGDTEPASVEQQRHLGRTAPSLYDLRNLFQINVEEARHLWAMVYLLHRFFGRDGREEADELLTRRSGHADHPRILNAFNAPIRDWIDLFCFAMFADRDGKYQLESLAESGFDPLARTTRFMLTEEAFHMFVGESGIQRIVQRTADLMRESGREDIHDLGGIELNILQKYINLWYTESLDLFGGEDSSNAASYFAAGLKGRFHDIVQPYSDHLALDGSYEPAPARWQRRGDSAAARDERSPARPYTQDCERGLARWNRELENATSMRDSICPLRVLTAESVRSPIFPAIRIASRSPARNISGDAPNGSSTQADRAHVADLLKPVYEPGKIAGWIAPAARGVNGQPLDFEYVIMS